MVKKAIHANLRAFNPDPFFSLCPYSAPNQPADQSATDCFSRFEAFQGEKRTAAALPGVVFLSFALSRVHRSTNPVPFQGFQNAPFNSVERKKSIISIAWISLMQTWGAIFGLVFVLFFGVESESVLVERKQRSACSIRPRLGVRWYSRKPSICTWIVVHSKRK